MNALAFTNPVMWGWALALGVPLAIHFLARRVPVRMVFPTVRFLKAAQASHSLPYRLRHLILLLVRTAVLLALLLAFLKPVLRAGAVALPKGDGGRNVVVVLDSSLSMGYTGEGFTPFARAQAAARRILDGLNASDRANVVYAAATPRASFEALSPNRFHLLRDLEAARPTLERADVDAAVALALKQLAEAEGSSREIHFVSDFQRGNWAAVKFETIPKEVATVFVSVAEEAAPNLAVTEAALQPASPAAGEPIDVICKVANYGPQAQETTVNLSFEGETFQEHVSAAPGVTSTVRFRLKAARPGAFEGIVSIADDALPADNTRHFAVVVSERVHVVVLSDESSFDPAAAHRFVVRAINPYGADDAGAVSVEVIKSDRFDKFAAARAQAVILAGVGALGESAAAQLVAYLRDGGSVAYFMGRPSDRESLQRIQVHAKGDLELPFQVGPFREGQDAGDFAMLGAANFDDPVLTRFRENGRLGDIRFYRRFATEREKGRGEILLRYGDRNIAMARKSMGLGTLLLCNFSPALDNSDLAKRPVFVPLVHEIIRNLRPQPGAGKPFHVGYPCSTTVTVAPTQSLRFQDPSGQAVNATFETSGGEAAVFFPPAAEPGFCRVFLDEQRLGSVAVNVDNRESNLESLQEAQLHELYGSARERFLLASGRDIAGLDRLGEGRPIWQHFLLAALCLAGLEQVLAWMWKG